MYRQPVLIYNPYAGKIRRNRERILQRTIAALGRAGMTPRVLPTDAAGHATELARTAIEEGADLVLALGGDGTLNEAANGMAALGRPAGRGSASSWNGGECALANELGTVGSSRPDRAAEKLAKCEPKSVALGRLTTADGASRYFLCMAGAGLDAKIVRDVSSGLKDRTGKVAYWAAGLAQFPHRVEQLEVRVKGKVYRCGFALASRVRNYGGDLEIASGASLLRDDFEVVLFESANPLRYAWYMFGVGLRRVQRMQGVQTLSAPCAEILCGTDLQMDGGYAGRQTARLETGPSGAGAAHSGRVWITARTSLTGLMMSRCRPGAEFTEVLGRHFRLMIDPGGGTRRISTFLRGRFSRQSSLSGSASAAKARTLCSWPRVVLALMPLLLEFRWISKASINWRTYLACLLGVLSHLALDLTNVYGVRVLLPFFLALAAAGHDGTSSTWWILPAFLFWRWPALYCWPSW